MNMNQVSITSDGEGIFVVKVDGRKEMVVKVDQAGWFSNHEWGISAQDLMHVVILSIQMSDKEEAYGLPELT